MKKIIFALLLLVLHTESHSQNPEEEKIRQLENEMKECFLKKDTIAMYKILSPDFVVNSPYNRVSTLAELKINLRNAGVGDTLSFDKNIEKITFTNGLAIVMGEEVRTSSGAASAGKTYQRRFTDIWIKQKNNWLLLARQSTAYNVE